MPENPIPTNDSDLLAFSFMPALQRDLQSSFSSQKDTGPSAVQDVVLLWIDIVLFSTMCNRLMKDTAYGVEKMTAILQEHYDFVLDLITRYNGKPLFFAGDGLMSAWPMNTAGPEQAVAQAVACAAEILGKRHTQTDQGERISLHAIIASGPLTVTEFESIRGRTLCSFSGEVFQQLIRTSKNRAVDQILISATVADLLDPLTERIPLEFDSFVITAPRPVNQIKPAPGPASRTEWSAGQSDKIRSYIPATLAFPLDRERMKWSAEIRPVTTVFVRITHSAASSEEKLAHFRKAVTLTVPLVQKYDGLINQVWMDEKDSNILICFGPPPTAHVDNPERGARLAFELAHILRQHQFSNTIGVSTGMAYCGILGNDHLRQYTVIGDVVNLSSRLAGIRQNTVFTDKSTFTASHKLITYEGPELVVVKGRTEPVPVYIPRQILIDQNARTAYQMSVGRDREMEQIRKALKESLTGTAHVILLEGDNGMGKSKLLSDLAASREAEAGRLIWCACDYVSRKTPYRSIQPILTSLLLIEKQQHEAVSEDMEASLAARLGPNACLLNIVLGTSIPDSEEVRLMTGAQRVAATETFLVDLFRKAAEEEPLILIVDDAQWLDEASMKLWQRLSKSVHPLFLLLSFQRTEGLRDIESIWDGRATHIVLGPLSDADQEILICNKLGTSALSEELSSLIRSKSKGNPFFCMELTGSLFDQDLLQCSSGYCSFRENVDVHALALPETVRGTIRSRIDRLDPGSQLSLKVGSVVGIQFAEKAVSSIFPIAGDRASVSGYLQDVEQFGFLTAGSVDNLNGYLFNNVATVEVAYEMTLAQQRKQLHRDIAEWYEQHFSTALAPFFLRLAFHWSRAGEPEKAVYYYECESLRIFRLGFAREALEIGLQGIELLGMVIPRDMASIQQQIGENFGAIQAYMQGRSVDEMATHFAMSDTRKASTIRLLLMMSPIAHQCQQGELFALLAIICQRQTLEFGNSAHAAEVYAMFSIIYKAFTGDSQGAFAWGRLSLEVDRLNGHTAQARVNFIYCWFIALWVRPIPDLLPLAIEGAESGLRSGDIIYGCFNLSLIVVLHSVSGHPLDEVQRVAAAYYLRNNRSVINASFHLMHEEQVAKAFMGQTNGLTSLTDEKFDEEKDIASICQTDLYNQIAYYLISKLKLNTHAGNWQEAVEWGAKVFPLLPAFANQPGHFELEQYYTMAALYHAAGIAGGDTAHLTDAAQAGIDRMYGWAAQCPETFSHKALLLDGIRESLFGDVAAAEQKFKTSADQAGQSGFTQDAGLAYEHLARLQQRLGMDSSIAHQKAKTAYQQWGATAKVRYLDELFSTPV